MAARTGSAAGASSGGGAVTAAWAGTTGVGCEAGKATPQANSVAPSSAGIVRDEPSAIVISRKPVSAPASRVTVKAIDARSGTPADDAPDPSRQLAAIAAVGPHDHDAARVVHAPSTNNGRVGDPPSIR